MKKTIVKTLSITALGVIMTLSAAHYTATPSYAAETVISAKTSGVIGEKADGLVGAVKPPASAEIQKLINSTNSKRIAKYKAVAKKNGLTLSQVKAVAGKKLASKVSSGQYVQDSSGKWYKK